MTVMTERIPLAEISRQAHQARFGRFLLACVTGVLFAAGWAVAKVFAVLWLCTAWCFTSVRVGWQHAQIRAATPKLSVQDQHDLLAEVERLRAEITHLTGG
jgi:hypothetical protein